MTKGGDIAGTRDEKRTLGEVRVACDEVSGECGSAGVAYEDDVAGLNFGGEGFDGSGELIEDFGGVVVAGGVATDSVGGVVIGVGVTGPKECGDNSVGNSCGGTGGEGVLIGGFDERGVTVEDDDEGWVGGELGAREDAGFGAVASGADPLCAALRGGSGSD